MILITGSTGLLGAHLLYHLLQSHPRVAALKRASSSTDTLREIFSFYTKTPDELLSRIDWRTGDMLDQASLVCALDGVTCVINCAAIVSFDGRERERMIANNVRGTENLVKAIISKENVKSVKNVKKEGVVLIHVSSTSALGDGPGDNPKFLIDEETPRDERRRHSGYSVSKYESERIVRESGLNAVVLNPGIILGPGQWDKGSSQLFKQAWESLRYFPYGGTGYVDVRDVAEVAGVLSVVGCRLSVGAGDRVERFCLVGANLRYREFFDMVTDEFGKPNPTEYAGKFLTEVAWRGEAVRAAIMRRKPLLTREMAESSQRISYYSSEKIKKALNFEFRPIEETIDWVAGWLVKSHS